MLAGDVAGAFYNAAHPTDVNNDGVDSITDVLMVIGELRNGGVRQLGVPLASGEGESNGSSSAFIDVNNDNMLSVMDALLVVDALRAEGEAGDIVLSLELTGTFGEPKSTVNFGDSFRIQALHRDARPVTAALPLADHGLASISFDLNFPTNLPRTGPVAAGPNHFTVLPDAFNPGVAQFNMVSVDFNQGTNDIINGFTTFTAGSADDMFNIDQDPPNPINFDVLNNDLLNGGTFNFTTSETTLPGQGFNFFAPDIQQQVPTSDVIFGGTSITIGVAGAVTIDSVSGVTAGATVSIVGGGSSINYTPAPSFAGTDTFSYTTTDGTNTSTALVTVEVAAIDAPPVASNGSDATNEDTVLNGDLNSLVSTPDAGDAHTFDTFNGLTGIGATFILNANGTFSYDPTGSAQAQALQAGDADLVETFVYTVRDNAGQTDSATLTVNVSGVNDAPVAADDGPFDVNENGVLNLPVNASILLNDTDIDGGALTASVATQPSKGSVVVNANGSFTYTPTANLNGADSFTYTANDGNGGTDTATVSINIIPASLPRAVDDNAATNAAFTVAYNTASGDLPVLANDVFDPAATSTNITAFDAASAQGGTITAGGAANTLVYTPPASLLAGTDTFTYTINDDVTDGVSNGPSTATVTITVTNQPPTVADENETTDEDTALNIAAPGVLAGDVDPEGLTLSISAFDAVSANGASVSVNQTTGAYTYDPSGSAALQALAAGETANDTFSYSVFDGVNTVQGQVTVLVNGVNDAPVANTDSGATDEDTMFSGNVISGFGANSQDTDIDASDTLSITGFDATSANGASVSIDAAGNLTYDPRGSATLQALHTGDTLNDTFNYTLSDGTTTVTGAVTIAVGGVNDAPVANNDRYVTDEDTTVNITVRNLGLLGNDTDVDTGDQAALTVINFDATSQQGASVSVSANGGFVYNPSGASALQALLPGQMVNDTFTYEIQDDNGLRSMATVTVEVSGVNDNPVANDDPFDIQQLDPGDPVAIFNVLANDTTVEPSETLMISAVAPGVVQGTATPTGSFIQISPDGKSIEYRNATGFEGFETFTYTVSDGNGGTDTATVTVEVVAFIPSTISGFVYLDTNDNGVREGVEDVLSGMRVHLRGTTARNESVSLDTLTDENGRYEFTELPPGVYTVTNEDDQVAGFLINGQTSLGASVDTGGQTLSAAEFSSLVNVDESIQFTIGELGDVVSVENNFGFRGLSPLFISVRDILASNSSFLSAGLVAVDAAGNVVWHQMPSSDGWSDFRDLQLEFVNNDSMKTRVSAAPTAGGLRDVSPTITVGDQRVQELGRNGDGVRLFRINGSAAAFGFGASPEGEGESASNSVAAPLPSGGVSGQGVSAQGVAEQNFPVVVTQPTASTGAQNADASRAELLVAEMGEIQLQQATVQGSHALALSLVDNAHRRYQNESSTFMDSVDALFGDDLFRDDSDLSDF